MISVITENCRFIWHREPYPFRIPPRVRDVVATLRAQAEEGAPVKSTAVVENALEKKKYRRGSKGNTQRSIPPRRTLTAPKSRVQKLLKSGKRQVRDPANNPQRRAKKQRIAFPTPPFVWVQYNDFIDDDFNEFFDHIVISSGTETSEFDEPEESSPNFRLSDATSNPSCSDDTDKMTALANKAFSYRM